MKSYKPLIDEQLARKKLTLRPGLIHKARPPLKIELIHIPYYFFRFHVRDRKGRRKTFCAAIDALLGSFALVDDAKLEAEEIANPEFHPALKIETVSDHLLSEARWFLRHKASKGRGQYEIESAEPGELGWYPFWIGYHKNRNGSLGFIAMDAINGAYQAGASRKAIMHAFINLRGSKD